MYQKGTIANFEVSWLQKMFYHCICVRSLPTNQQRYTSISLKQGSTVFDASASCLMLCSGEIVEGGEEWGDGKPAMISATHCPAPAGTGDV